MGRLYNFSLPYIIPGFLKSAAISKLKNADVWLDLPPDLQDRLLDRSWNSVEVTAEDLDRIPHRAWCTIADHLNLDWEDDE